jgi:hypothetical protein
MNIKNFSISGYARFYRSLPRFFRDMSNSHALKLTYGLYAAVNDAYRYKNPGAYLTEYDEDCFYDVLRQTNVKPYRTEIQLYRAMEAILFNLEIPALKNSRLACVMELSFMMCNTELRFYKAFDMEIDDERTIYRMCARSLIPRRDEPGLCIKQDWIDAVSA